MSTRLILDCDPGTDDAVALMLAALHPRLDLVGVTTVHGNHDVAHTTDNALRVLDHIGRCDVPVFAGLDRPIGHGRRCVPAGTGAERSPYLPLPPARRSAQERPAVEWLVQTLRAATERLTLVCTGPLTNVAAALTVAPGLVDTVAEVVVMGGTHAVGNVTPSAERNVWSDPVAASVVLGAGFERLVLVPLDATHRAPLTEDHARALRVMGTPAGTTAAALVEQRIPRYGGAAAPVHDPLTVAYLLTPAVLSLRPVHVAVETAGRLTYGRTVMDLDAVTGQAPNAQVALRADADTFFDVLQTTFC